MKLLLIEDDQNLRTSTAEFLSSEGFIVESAGRFETASQKIDLFYYDCVIVDLSLPGGSGLDLIRELKKTKPATGIIVTSAKSSLETRLKSLEIGADDYLVKPFHMRELSARIKAIIRRREFGGDNHLENSGIEIYFNSHNVIVNGREVPFTRKEYDLLEYLITNKNKVVSREMIAEHLRGDDISTIADTFDFIYTHIKNVRQKLRLNGCRNCIRTIYGIGYKFVC